jgi:hypothetical protein
VELVGDRDYYAVICLGIFARVSMLMSFQQSGQKFLARLARPDFELKSVLSHRAPIKTQIRSL